MNGTQTRIVYFEEETVETGATTLLEMDVP
jgi:hypothetical protein